MKLLVLPDFVRADRGQDSIRAARLQKEGISAGKKGDFESALEKFTEAYLLREKMYGSTSIKLASPLNNMGVTYKNLGNFEKAIEVYKRIESLCLQSALPNSADLGIAYTNLGNIYRLNGDYNQAFEYQKNAYRVLKNDSIKYLSNLQICKYNILETQFKLGKNDEVIFQAEKYIKEVATDLKARLFDLIALAFKDKGLYKLSEQNFNSALQTWTKIYGDNNVELISEYLSYSSMLLSIKQFDKALLLIQKADNLVLNFYNRKSVQYSEVLLSFGDYYYLKDAVSAQIDDFRKKRKESLSKSLKYYQDAIVALVDSFSNTDIFANPQLDNVISEIQLVEVMKKKALALDKLGNIYESELDRRNAIRYYESSLNSYALAMDLIHRLQTGFENEDSRLFLAQNQQATFQEAIGTAYNLFKITKDNRYSQKAFEFSERSKSSNLLVSLRDIKAKEFGGIPDSLLEKESEYKSYIATYKSKLFEETHTENVDSQMVNLFSSKLFKYNEEYNRLIDSFEKNYPRYYSLKYENKVIDALQIKSRLNQRQALLEYYLKSPENETSEGELYLFAITADSISLYKQSIDGEFGRRIQTFHDFLISSDYLNTQKSDYVNYINSAYYLYEKLIQPVSRKLVGKSLTIIPHDKLSYVPFDALISEKPDTLRMNFRDLKYLIRDYSINYGYSATLVYDAIKKKRAARRLLIFSPEYNYQEARKDIETGKTYHLSPLPGSKNEIKAISNYISADSFTDQNAQESTFKKDAGNFDILHLAMHTIINDSIPMLSKLVFSTPLVNSPDDGNLNAYEIYNMKLNARLAVLSACETGSGKLQGGEGVMSMARGFIYAGCPSVIMTLWQVEDKSGVKIMDDFYRYLSKGKRKDEALRMAKLNHLKNSDPLTAHPHFWLGYVSIGNAEPLYTSNDVYFVIFLLITLLILFADYHFRRKRWKTKQK
jgi:CHAT domain-containing protein